MLAVLLILMEKAFALKRQQEHLGKIQDPKADNLSARLRIVFMH